MKTVLPSKEHVHPFWKEGEKTLGSLCFVLTGLRKGNLSTLKIKKKKKSSLASFLPFCFDWALCLVYTSINGTTFFQKG